MLFGWRSPGHGAGRVKSKAVQECFREACLSANHSWCFDLKSWLHCLGQTQAALVSCSRPHASPRGTGRGLLSWPASKQVPEVSPLPLQTKGLPGDPRPCGSGITHIRSQVCSYFGKVPAFLNAPEIEVVPLQQESSHAGGSRTIFELGTIIFPKLFLSRKLLLWEKLFTKRQGCG